MNTIIMQLYLYPVSHIRHLLGSKAQSVACLTTDLGIFGIPAWPHITFMEIDHEIISSIILPVPLIQEGL